ncbi:SDR family oxidoreductase [Alkalicella caledoniensis]|uniref:SDR family oxidoreductase n=1 Tax=Alkalicella caledoniensis TaxID=2731377 RepID=A0A7G9W5K5_ALKCA|nr:SDR family oxidoreductase [Alkalicella caledoniensis]QNO13967.1 SDR family oxidoreductase [Alkalicella caledoniensis]
MKNKVVLITGANSGVGKATATELARMGATIIMACRNKERGEEALKEVRERSNSKKVELMLCDLASLSDIRCFCEKFEEKYQRLDVLINNAGVILPRRQLTKDGFEMQLGVNHFGHFLLTNLLLNLLTNSSHARIINVSSGAHKVGKIQFEDLGLEKRYNLMKAYSRSKLANILFTYELARRLEGTGVTVNCLHPGAVSTNMGVDRETGFGKLIHKILKGFLQTPLEGAATSIYLATSKEVEGVSGKYFYKQKPIESSKSSHDIDLAKRLWNVSEAVVGLKE